MEFTKYMTFTKRLSTISNTANYLQDMYKDALHKIEVLENENEQLLETISNYKEQIVELIKKYESN